MNSGFKIGTLEIGRIVLIILLPPCREEVPADAAETDPRLSR